MARQTQVVLTDDIDGTEATETISFALDNTHYEIDLNDKNADKLREVLEVYVANARRASNGRGSGRGRRRAPSSSVAVDPRAVRAWANANGIRVNARGRISSDVVNQFLAAGN